MQRATGHRPTCNGSLGQACGRHHATGGRTGFSAPAGRGVRLQDVLRDLREGEAEKTKLLKSHKATRLTASL